MIGMSTDHWQVVNESLQRGEGMDETALASVTALRGRLDSLKQTHPSFAGISLSPDVERARQVTVA